MLPALLSLGPSIVEAVSGVFKRKQAAQSAATKLALKKETGVQHIELTDAEWETVTTSLQHNTWKDELVTVTFVMPLWLIMAGAITAAFTGDYRLLDGTTEGIKALVVLGLDFGLLTMAVVFAAVGLKIWRKN